MADYTCIQIYRTTKKQLDAVKLCKDETYNSVIERLIEKVQEK